MATNEPTIKKAPWDKAVPPLYTTPEVAIAALNAKVGEMDDKLDRVLYILDGNGEAGHVIRLDRLEQRELARSKLQWIVLTACVTSLILWVGTWMSSSS